MKLLYFSILKERLKAEFEEIEFSGKVSELRRFLIEKYPELEDIIKVSMFAVNYEYVGEDFELKGGEVVAVIPPVSGG